MHALLDAGFGPHRDAKQLDPVAEFGRGFEIGKRDRGDAFDVDRLRIDLGAESEAGQMASFCAVSKPSISKVGSASA